MVTTDELDADRGRGAHALCAGERSTVKLTDPARAVDDTDAETAPGIDTLEASLVMPLVSRLLASGLQRRDVGLQPGDGVALQLDGFAWRV